MEHAEQIKGQQRCPSIGVSFPLPVAYSANTSRSPASISSICVAVTRPIFSVRKRLSTATSWDTLTTETLSRPVPLVGNSTFPGAVATRRLLVTIAASTVRIPLLLKSLDWTMTTGRRYPGMEPAGSGNEAHQISPRRITTHPWEENATASWRPRDQAQSLLPLHRRPHSTVRLRFCVDGGQRSPQWRWRRAHCERPSSVSPGVPPSERVDRVTRLPFS